jgi:hypothetical protein
MSEEAVGQIENTGLVNDILRTNERMNGLYGALKAHLEPIFKQKRLTYMEEQPEFEVVAEEDKIVTGVTSEAGTDYLLKIDREGHVTLEPIV